MVHSTADFTMTNTINNEINNLYSTQIFPVQIHESEKNLVYPVKKILATSPEKPSLFRDYDRTVKLNGGEEK